MDLGQEGLSLVQHRVDVLGEIAESESDSSGVSTEIRRWSIDLVKLLAPRVATGVVLDGGDVEVPEGLLPYQRDNFAFGERNDRVMRRFLDPLHGRFCVIPSWNDASYPEKMRDSVDPDPYFTHGEALYWVIPLPSPVDARLSALVDNLGLMCPWSPLAVMGDATFDTTSEALITSQKASYEQVQTLARTTTRILTEGSICGSYLLWESR